jgi:hypothetical protein
MASCPDPTPPPRTADAVVRPHRAKERTTSSPNNPSLGSAARPLDLATDAGAQRFRARAGQTGIPARSDIRTDDRYDGS